MGDLSALEEAFFRSGDLVSEAPAPAPAEPRLTWWRRLFRAELRGWAPLVGDELADD
jgi:hypothetical protein